jgi:hypothetical protein
MKSPFGKLLHNRNPFLKGEWEKVNMSDIDERNKKSNVLL